MVVMLYTREKFRLEFLPISCGHRPKRFGQVRARCTEAAKPRNHLQIGFSFPFFLPWCRFIGPWLFLHSFHESVDDERMQRFVFLDRFDFQTLMEILGDLKGKRFFGFWRFHTYLGYLAYLGKSSN